MSSVASPLEPFDLLQGSLVALFCGLFIGLEREMGKAEERHEAAPAAVNPAGIRTTAMVALLGAMLRVLDLHLGLESAFSIIGFVATALVVIGLYGVRAAKTGHYGATSSITLLSTYALGVFSFTELRMFAAGAAVVMTGVLAMKAPLHGFVRKLAESELVAAVKLGLIALVLLPILPDRDFGPLDWPWLAGMLRRTGVSDDVLRSLAILNPWKLWFFVVAISAVEFVGYVLVRALGSGKGLTLTGLLGGLVSSTAVTLSIAGQSKTSREEPGVQASAILAACTVMSVRVIVIVLAIAPTLTVRALVAMVPMLAVTAISALRLSKSGGSSSRSRAHDGKQAVELRTPFALAPALKLTGLFFAVRVVSKILTIVAGGAGLLASAAFSGLVDVDAITIAVSQEAKGDDGGLVSADIAIVAIFVAVAMNTIVKSGMTLVLGSRDVGRVTAVWLGASLLAGGTGLFVTTAWL